jgi:hypothetical protein
VLILLTRNSFGEFGAIIYEVMHGADDFDLQARHKNNDPMWEKWDEKVETAYSKTLVRLVKTCLKHEQGSGKCSRHVGYHRTGCRR